MSAIMTYLGLRSAWSIITNPMVLALAAVATFASWSAWEQHRGAVRARIECRAVMAKEREDARQRLAEAERAANEAADKAIAAADARKRRIDEVVATILREKRDAGACSLSDADIERLRSIK